MTQSSFTSSSASARDPSPAEVQRKLEEQQERERQEVERLGRLAKEAIMAKVMAAHLNMSIEEFGAFRKVQYKRRIEAVFALLLMSTD
jgi:hypothetical protein